jgi:hypothetical protein
MESISFREPSILIFFLAVAVTAMTFSSAGGHESVEEPGMRIDRNGYRHYKGSPTARKEVVRPPAGRTGPWRGEENVIGEGRFGLCGGGAFSPMGKLGGNP